jgi:hypothetical protein
MSVGPRQSGPIEEIRRAAGAAARRLSFPDFVRRRRRRTALGAAAAAGALSLVLVSTALLGRVEPDQASPITAPSTTPATTTTLGTMIPAATPFVPATRHSAPSTVVPLGFVDGTTAELTYPDRYDFLSKGVELQGAFDASGYGRTFTMRHGPIAEQVAREAAVAGSSTRLASYPDPRGGNAELWRFGTDADVDHLYITFGDWTLDTWDYAANHGESRDETLASWVQSAAGHVAANGYPVLTGGETFAIAAVLRDGGPDGPDLRLGGADGDIMLFLNQCELVPDDDDAGDGVLEWCDPATQTRIAASGDPATLRDLRTNLRITGLADRAAEAILAQQPYVAGGQFSCLSLSRGWQDGFSHVGGPLWLRSSPASPSDDGGNLASKTIVTLEPGEEPVTLTVPLGWRNQVSHLFDSSTWTGSYEIDPDYGAVTFLPCGADPAQYIGGFVFRPEARCAPFEATGAIEGLVTVSLDGEPCHLSWARHTDPEKDFTITYPSGWFVAPDTLTPSLGFPMLVAVSTFQAPVGGGRCAQFATAGFDAIGPGDVLLTIHELPFAYANAPRPADFRSGVGFPPGDFQECISDPGRLHGGEFRYFDNGRAFDAILAMGPDVSTEDEDAAWAMLTSFFPIALDLSPGGCALPDDVTTRLLSHVPGAPAFPDGWIPARGTLPVFTDPDVTRMGAAAMASCTTVWTAAADGEQYELIGLAGGDTSAAYVQTTGVLDEFAPNMLTYGLEGLGDLELQHHDDGTFTGRFDGDRFIGIALDGWALDFFIDAWAGGMSP